MNKGKSFEIPRQLVFEAYKCVKANRGAGGVDGIDLEEFELNLKDNLYKLWNRMSSGSYFPKAVRGVEIPKKNGKKRLLGIPTIEDRIAQMVVRMKLEARVEPIFLNDSYGYRPNKSAIDAIGVVRERCWELPWVLEFDIVGLFDNIDHELMMKLVKMHTESKWVIMYIERVLKAPIHMPNGDIQERKSGTPQGGVISPVLANLFLHYAFDKWMTTQYVQNPWVRYADDGVIHCRSKEEAEIMLINLKERMKICKLEIHDEKTKIVYCKSYKHNQENDIESFDFLGYTFKRRYVKSKYGNLIEGFTPAVSKSASENFRSKIRGKRFRHNQMEIEELAELLNPIIRGWANYFTQFSPEEAKRNLKYVNQRLVYWIKRKFKSAKRSNKKARELLTRIEESKPSLFYHWQLGISPTIG